jgi:hypothetical protein
MGSKEDNFKWLMARMDEYRSTKNNIGEVVEDFDEVSKLGRGLATVDELDEIDIADGTSG